MFRLLTILTFCAFVSSAHAEFTGEGSDGATFYEVLGVELDATPEQIAAATEAGLAYYNPSSDNPHGDVVAYRTIRIAGLCLGNGNLHEVYDTFVSRLNKLPDAGDGFIHAAIFQTGIKLWSKDQLRPEDILKLLTDPAYKYFVRTTRNGQLVPISDARLRAQIDSLARLEEDISQSSGEQKKNLLRVEREMRALQEFPHIDPPPRVVEPEPVILPLQTAGAQCSRWWRVYDYGIAAASIGMIGFMAYEGVQKGIEESRTRMAQQSGIQLYDISKIDEVQPEKKPTLVPPPNEGVAARTDALHQSPLPGPLQSK